jgi:hypothetical protein
MQHYNRLNNLFGWLAFVVSAVVYILTIEPTTSFWDCGEFISSAYKLLVGHPPGAPFFMLLGRFFTLFAGDPSRVALTMNVMSALASAFTIMFLFWTITHLARKVFIDAVENAEPWRIIAVMGAGFVGAMVYTFSDTFWFSAVEGEVYALSSLFTAVVFWCILKWENVADEPHSNRWLILIAYLMGLSIGVHLLNLLTIPAIVMVYYFRKYDVSLKGAFKALLLSFVILGVVLYGVIPMIVNIASKFELIFVNSFGLPFNSGVAFFALLLIAAVIFGIYITYVRELPVANTIITAFAVIVLGYSSYATIVIRSHANPTMDQNSPEDVFSLMGYLNREQYGNRPLISGQYYSSPLDWDAIKADKGKPVYVKGDGKYDIVDHRPDYKFNERTTTLFPRMYSSDPSHINEYKAWGRVKGKTIIVTDASGKREAVELPTFIENLRFFISYQVGHMYLRYFMWNFAGRQNDIQGHGEIHKGNWISGIPFIDNLLYGDQDLLPDSYKNNPGRNKYYMLPLLLGLIGLFYQVGAGTRGKRDFSVVMLLFFFTGLAIVIYLNQTPLQPRERDYAYAGSFYAFSIWIGLGVLQLIDILKNNKVPGVVTASAVSLVALIVPGIMAAENWDDHDRSHRTIARDFAYNYLNTVGENGVIFTNGDNDTFPLWYAQEVEGVRTDVRVCNLSYLQTDWYIDQMKRPAYKSEPLPISMERKQYVQGKRDVVYLLDRVQGDTDLKEALKFLASDDPRTKNIPNYGLVDHLPAKKFVMKVDSARVAESGMVSSRYTSLIKPEIRITLNKERLLKNEVMVLDMLATNDFNRPIYYAVTVGSDNYVGLERYFQLEGFGYQIVPIDAQSRDGQYGRVDTQKMYDNVMNKYIFTGWDDPRVYLDENHRRMGLNLRNNLTRLASALLSEGDTAKAVEVLDKTVAIMPHDRVPHNFFSLFIAENYYKAGEPEKGDQVMRELAEENLQELRFFAALGRSFQVNDSDDFQLGLAIYANILDMLESYNREELRNELGLGYEAVFSGLSFLRK